MISEDIKFDFKNKKIRYDQYLLVKKASNVIAEFLSHGEEEAIDCKPYVQPVFKYHFFEIRDCIDIIKKFIDAVENNLFIEEEESFAKFGRYIEGIYDSSSITVMIESKPKVYATISYIVDNSKDLYEKYKGKIFTIDIKDLNKPNAFGSDRLITLKEI